MEALRDGDIFLFICSFVCLSVAVGGGGAYRIGQSGRSDLVTVNARIVQINLG